MSPARLPFTVVIVDDYGDLRALYRVVFQRTGDFIVLGEATDGLEGLTAARKHQPDLLLLDVSMPIMDGMEALPLIVAACPTTTVVMLTAHGIDSGLPERASALGAAGYIIKGTPLPTVLEELREILARRQQPSADAPPDATP